MSEQFNEGVLELRDGYAEVYPSGLAVGFHCMTVPEARELRDWLEGLN